MLQRCPIPVGGPDPQDLLKGVKVRVYPVGPDYNTEGLLLMTNDGDFAHLITHPKHEFPKTYLAKVKGVVDAKSMSDLEQGIYLEDGKTAPAKIKKVRKEQANSWLEITIHEGRKRQVRHQRPIGWVIRAIKLKRIRTGNLSLGDLGEGTYRHLTPVEVKALKETAGKAEYRIQKPASMVRHKPESKRTGARSRRIKAEYRISGGTSARDRGPQAAPKGKGQGAVEKYQPQTRKS